MKLRRVSIAQIRVPETRVTAVYDEDTLRLLRDTVDKLGILQPLIVVGRDGDYELVDGLHRLEEARRKGDQAVDAVVYEGEAQDTLLLNLILNRVRGKTKASEMVTVIGRLYEDYGVGIEGIEEKTGISRNLIEKYIVVSKAASSVQEALDQELIGIGGAYEIARLPHRSQQDQVIAQQGVYHWSVKYLKELVDGAIQAEQGIREAPAPPQRVVVPPTYVCQVCKMETDPRELRPVMTCPSCYGAGWQRAQPTPPETPKEVVAEETPGG